MQVTIKVPLELTKNQEEILFDTGMLYTKCYNMICRYGWDNNVTNKVEIHKATYYPIRNEFPKLNSSLVQAARDKAIGSLKSAKSNKKYHKVSCPSSSLIPIQYNKRTFTLDLKNNHVSLSSIEGRIHINFKTSNHAKKWIAKAEGYKAEGYASAGCPSTTLSPLQYSERCVLGDVTCM